ncbi:unnamed protein product [Acanthoscelides obtectus]|uniref:Lipase n=1 Tax=Acanthoscelides obtectus TaxID=200917 RepID=A0A9P0L4Z6_ACAOB|nr:unnamed protein product [Acanthoscelides obtectus]CAK1671107.1 Lipase 3 [Acanthoscelides obtectus]
MLTVGFLLAYVCFADAKGLGLFGSDVLGLKNYENYKDNPIIDKSFLQQLPSLIEEAKSYTTLDIIERNGYKAENHYTTTSDGYILNLHRIPEGKTGRKNNKVAFLQHGILASSSDWVISGSGKSLGYALADEGYDVWMGNNRGNMYSRNHTKLDPDKDLKFWDFSWHEIGTTDLPAMIDYVLNQTGVESLYYVGHSQGTTVFYVFASERPDYQKKVKAHVSLAPIGYMGHATSPVIRLAGMLVKAGEMFYAVAGQQEVLPRQGFIGHLSEILCAPGNKLTLLLCENLVFTLTGFNPEQTNTSLLPDIMAHAPAGCSTKQMLHYGQELGTGHFRQYDYGMVNNLRKYKSIHPPRYYMKNIKIPMYLIYSRNDWISSETDTRKLCTEIGSSCKAFLISDKSFNHLDFVYGIYTDTLVNPKVLSSFARH